MRKKSRKKNKRILRIVLMSSLILLVSLAISTFELYKRVLKSNVVTNSDNPQYLYVHSTDDFDDVCQRLIDDAFVKNINSFIWLAERKNYPRHINPGKYLIKDGMSNNELINKLRSGDQEMVYIMFQNIRTLNELAGLVGRTLEADSANFMSLVQDVSFIQKYGFNRAQIISMFLPNTYEFYWSTKAEGFFKRMAKEYKAFWTEERKAQARKLNLSQTEVTTLASIVQAEQTIRPDERPKVAGLYLNRLRKGMRLESDPTIIYALNDFTIKRVLNDDRKVNSPYNTYMYKGLPPGPINIPELSSIDAVLNPEKHDFIFMCAKEDFSGYHNFAKTFREHSIFANRYRKELNKRKIYR